MCDLGTNAPFTSLAADLGREGRGANGNAHWTSCPFAREVRAAYINEVGIGRYGTLRVVSPIVPEQGPITMTCSPQSDSMVICTGGQEAKIYIY